MSEISISEQQNDSCNLITKPAEKETPKAEAIPKNDFFREVTASMLSNAVTTVDTLFGPILIVDKRNGNAGVKVNGARVDEMPARTIPEEPVFKAVEASEDEITNLRKIASPEQIKAAKTEINEHGRDPKGTLLEAIKNNRIVALGESAITCIGLRTLVETTAPLFAASGVTHLAVNIDPKYQKILDRAIDGDRAAFKKLQEFSGPHYDHDLRMMQALAKEGVKVVAVDDDDRDVASRIAKIVEADPQAKVLCYLSFLNLRRTPDGEKSAGEQLKERGQQKGYSVATYRAYYDSDADSEGLHFAKHATRPVSVETGRTEVLKNISSKIDDTFIDTVGDYDHAIFFPAFSAVTMAELDHGPRSPKIVPALDNLIAAKAVEQARMEIFKQAGGEEKKVEAEFLSQWAIDIETQIYGKNSPQLAQRYESMLQKLHSETGELEQAEKLLSAHTLLDKSSYWHRELAYRYEKNGDPENARRHWQQALENGKSDDAKLLAYYALAKNSLTEKHRQEKYFKEAISLLHESSELGEMLVNGLLTSYADFLVEDEREEDAEAVLTNLRKDSNGEPVFSDLLRPGSVDPSIE